MVGVTFAERNASESDEPLQPHERDHDLQNMNGIPQIDHVNVTGPYSPTGPGDTPSRRRIFTCTPQQHRRKARVRGAFSPTWRGALSASGDERGHGADPCALRRRPEEGQLRCGHRAGPSPDPRESEFLFRTETRRVQSKTGAATDRLRRRAVSDIELASRLSFFLWSSIPDEELLTLATKGSLESARRARTPGEADARRSEVTRAGGQLRQPVADAARSKGHIPTPGDFPNFDNELRQAFRQETELFFESIMREDRSLIDLINADYTFVNERLARHYGIPNVHGSYFRKVVLKNDERRGLLGQGSILTVTSYPNRTSPVLRGKSILENILGTPPPSPPPDVPDLQENHPGRRRSRCARGWNASCHRRLRHVPPVMDPLGLALENFDGVGEWRVKEPGGNIDPAGQLADGSRVDGPVALRKAVMKRPELFVRTVTQKLMTYGLGRGSRTPTCRRSAASRRRRGTELPLLVDRAGHREERAVPDENGAKDRLLASSHR